MKNKDQTVKTAGWINVVAGLWLIAAPFLLHYRGSASITNDIIFGVIIGVTSLIIVFSPVHILWLSWINTLTGIWLILAPFVLNYPLQTARLNDIVVGIIVAVAGIWSSSESTVHRERHARA